MTEIVFRVEHDPDGGYTATALGQSIFTQADDIETLQIMIRDAVHCHFPDAEKRPKIIRLHIVIPILDEDAPNYITNHVRRALRRKRRVPRRRSEGKDTKKE